MGLSQSSSAKEVYKGCILENEAVTADHLLLKCFQTQQFVPSVSKKNGIRYSLVILDNPYKHVQHFALYLVLVWD